MKVISSFFLKKVTRFSFPSIRCKSNIVEVIKSEVDFIFTL
jgi:hypothetical protein